MRTKIRKAAAVVLFGEGWRERFGAVVREDDVYVVMEEKNAAPPIPPIPWTAEEIGRATARAVTCGACAENKRLTARAGPLPVFVVKCGKCGTCGGLSLRSGRCPMEKW